MASVLVSLLVLRVSSFMVSLIVSARGDSVWRCKKNEGGASVRGREVVQGALEQCCMMFPKEKGRLCTCRYRADDTGDCLLDMLIREHLYRRWPMKAGDVGRS